MPEMLAYFGRRFSVTARVERACARHRRRGAPNARHRPPRRPRCDGGAHERLRGGVPDVLEGGMATTGETGEAHVSFRPTTRSTSCEDWPQEARGPERNPRGGRRLPMPGDGVTPRNDAAGMVECTFLLPRGGVRHVSRWRSSASRCAACSRRSCGVWAYGSRPLHRPAESSVDTPLWRVHPGKTVKIHSTGDIAETLDAERDARGLWFDREMLPYCGTEPTVQTTLGRFIDERSGEMMDAQDRLRDPRRGRL